MKRTIVALFCLVCIFSFTSCATVDVKISFSKSVDEVSFVEIYDLEKVYTEADVHNLREENTPVCILSGDEVEPFLNEIASLDFTEERIYFPAPVDWIHLYQDCVISVVYTDDSQ